MATNGLLQQMNPLNGMTGPLQSNPLREQKLLNDLFLQSQRMQYGSNKEAHKQLQILQTYKDITENIAQQLAKDENKKIVSDLRLLSQGRLPTKVAEETLKQFQALGNEAKKFVGETKGITDYDILDAASKMAMATNYNFGASAENKNDAFSSNYSKMQATNKIEKQKADTSTVRNIVNDILDAVSTAGSRWYSAFFSDFTAPKADETAYRAWMSNPYNYYMHTDPDSSTPIIDWLNYKAQVEKDNKKAVDREVERGVERVSDYYIRLATDPVFREEELRRSYDGTVPKFREASNLAAVMIEAGLLNAAPLALSAVPVVGPALSAGARTLTTPLMARLGAAGVYNQAIDAIVASNMTQDKDGNMVLTDEGRKKAAEQIELYKQSDDPDKTLSLILGGATAALPVVGLGKAGFGVAGAVKGAVTGQGVGQGLNTGINNFYNTMMRQNPYMRFGASLADHMTTGALLGYGQNIAGNATERVLGNIGVGNSPEEIEARANTPYTQGMFGETVPGMIGGAAFAGTSLLSGVYPKIRGQGWRYNYGLPHNVRQEQADNIADPYLNESDIQAKQFADRQRGAGDEQAAKLAEATIHATVKDFNPNQKVGVHPAFAGLDPNNPVQAKNMEDALVNSGMDRAEAKKLVSTGSVGAKKEDAKQQPIINLTSGQNNGTKDFVVNFKDDNFEIGDGFSKFIEGNSADSNNQNGVSASDYLAKTVNDMLNEVRANADANNSTTYTQQDLMQTQAYQNLKALHDMYTQTQSFAKGVNNKLSIKLQGDDIKLDNSKMSRNSIPVQLKSKKEFDNAQSAGNANAFGVTGKGIFISKDQLNSIATELNVVNNQSNNMSPVVVLSALKQATNANIDANTINNIDQLNTSAGTPFTKNNMKPAENGTGFVFVSQEAMDAVNSGKLNFGQFANMKQDTDAFIQNRQNINNYDQFARDKYNQEQEEQKRQAQQAQQAQQNNQPQPPQPQPPLEMLKESVKEGAKDAKDIVASYPAVEYNEWFYDPNAPQPQQGVSLGTVISNATNNFGTNISNATTNLGNKIQNWLSGFNGGTNNNTNQQQSQPPAPVVNSHPQAPVPVVTPQQPAPAPVPVVTPQQQAQVVTPQQQAPVVNPQQQAPVVNPQQTAQVATPQQTAQVATPQQTAQVDVNSDSDTRAEEQAFMDNLDKREDFENYDEDISDEDDSDQQALPPSNTSNDGDNDNNKNDDTDPQVVNDNPEPNQPNGGGGGAEQVVPQTNAPIDFESVYNSKTKAEKTRIKKLYKDIKDNKINSDGVNAFLQSYGLLSEQGFTEGDVVKITDFLDNELQSKQKQTDTSFSSMTDEEKRELFEYLAHPKTELDKKKAKISKHFVGSDHDKKLGEELTYILKEITSSKKRQIALTNNTTITKNEFRKLVLENMILDTEHYVDTKDIVFTPSANTTDIVTNNTTDTGTDTNNTTDIVTNNTTDIVTNNTTDTGNDTNESKSDYSLKDVARTSLPERQAAFNDLHNDTDLNELRTMLKQYSDDKGNEENFANAIIEYVKDYELGTKEFKQAFADALQVKNTSIDTDTDTGTDTDTNTNKTNTDPDTGEVAILEDSSYFNSNVETLVDDLSEDGGQKNSNYSLKDVANVSQQDRQAAFDELHNETNLYKLEQALRDYTEGNEENFAKAIIEYVKDYEPGTPEFIQALADALQVENTAQNQQAEQEATTEPEQVVEQEATTEQEQVVEQEATTEQEQVVEQGDTTKAEDFNTDEFDELDDLDSFSESEGVVNTTSTYFDQHTASIGSKESLEIGSKESLEDDSSSDDGSDTQKGNQSKNARAGLTPDEIKILDEEKAKYLKGKGGDELKSLNKYWEDNEQKFIGLLFKKTKSEDTEPVKRGKEEFHFTNKLRQLSQDSGNGATGFYIEGVTPKENIKVGQVGLSRKTVTEVVSLSPLGFTLNSVLLSNSKTKQADKDVATLNAVLDAVANSGDQDLQRDVANTAILNNALVMGVSKNLGSKLNADNATKNKIIEDALYMPNEMKIMALAKFAEVWNEQASDNDKIMPNPYISNAKYIIARVFGKSKFTSSDLSELSDIEKGTSLLSKDAYKKANTVLNNALKEVGASKIHPNDVLVAIATRKEDWNSIRSFTYNPDLYIKNNSNVSWNLPYNFDYNTFKNYKGTAQYEETHSAPDLTRTVNAFTLLDKAGKWNDNLQGVAITIRNAIGDANNDANMKSLSDTLGEIIQKHCGN